ncbi:MAG: hypothetical protein NVSMB31_18080 [Vulcanimicrobiaceae bacterium]
MVTRRVFALAGLLFLGAALGQTSASEQMLSVHVGRWHAAVLAGTVPHARTYEVLTKGTPGQTVLLQAQAIPKGWVASFCTPRICSPFRVSITVGRLGTTATEFQIVPSDAGARLRLRPRMTARSRSQQAAFAFESSPIDASPPGGPHPTRNHSQL